MISSKLTASFFWSVVWSITLSKRFSKYSSLIYLWNFYNFVCSSSSVSYIFDFSYKKFSRALAWSASGWTFSTSGFKIVASLPILGEGSGFSPSSPSLTASVFSTTVRAGSIEAAFVAWAEASMSSSFSFSTETVWFSSSILRVTTYTNCVAPSSSNNGLLLVEYNIEGS